MEQKLIAGMLTHVWHYNTWWVVTLHEAIEIEEKIPKEKRFFMFQKKNFRIWSLKWKKKLTKEVEEKVESPSSSVMPDNGTVEEPFPDFNHNLGHFGKISPLFPAITHKQLCKLLSQEKEGTCISKVAKRFLWEYNGEVDCFNQPPVHLQQQKIPQNILEKILTHLRPWCNCRLFQSFCLCGRKEV